MLAADGPALVYALTSSTSGAACDTALLAIENDSHRASASHIWNMTTRHVGVFLVTCALHATGIHYVASQDVANRDSTWGTLQVSFIPAEKPTEPPPAPLLPVLMTDAFAERQLIDIPPPEIELAIPQTVSRAIHAPAPEPLPQTDSAPQEDQGYGPLTRPRAISGPDSQDRYPRASVRRGESGRTVVKICISANGTVESVEVAESSGYPRLDRAAVDIGWDYVFAPAMREGKAVPVCLPYGIKFRIGISGSRRGR